jgi:hypothetical protein
MRKTPCIQPFCEETSWVMGFGKEAEVLEHEHLRQAVAEELTSTVEKYVSEPAAVMEEDVDYRRR